MDREQFNKRKRGACATTSGDRRRDEKCEHEKRLAAVVAKRNELAQGDVIQASAAEYITDALLAPIEE